MQPEPSNNKLVSAVITTHNRRDLVIKAIDSVFAQTYPEIELIVVDDASGDATRDILTPLANERGFKYIYIPKEESRDLENSILNQKQILPVGNRNKTTGFFNIKFSWVTFFQYAFIICVILNFRAVWLHTSSFEWLPRIVKLLMGISVVLGAMAKRRFSSARFSKCLAVMALTIFYFGVWYFLDPIKSSSIFTILIQLLAIIVFCLLIEDSINDTLRKFSNIVLIIAVVSLLFWVSGSLLGILKPSGYIYSTWSGSDSLRQTASYYGIYFETQTANLFGFLGNYIVRNTAIFTEAPMASFIFSTAFCSELFLSEKTNKLRCIILGIAVLSTISTTGWTAVIIAIGLKYIFSKTKSRGSLYLKLVILPVAFIFILVALNFLVEQKLDTGSGMSRMHDFINGFTAWLDSPVFGYGYGSLESVRSLYGNTAYCNSITPILVQGGLYLFLPFLVPLFIAFGRLAGKRKWNRLGFYLVFFYMFIITIVPFQMLTWYIFICMARDGTRDRVPIETN